MKAVKEILWAERTREELSDWAKRGTVVIVPIGSIEQHGHHLPVNTDDQTVEYVARRAACLADAPVLVTPTIPFGVSPHHMMYGGTISLRVETVINLLRDICESITAHGFERILILSGHGGNSSTIGAAALELKYRLNREIRAMCWWDLVPEIFEAVREGPKVGIGHSGEMETSTILFLSPESVRRERYKLVSGITDDPSLATETKGEKVLNAAAEAIAKLLKELAAAPGQKVSGIEPVTKK
nr:putative creatininase [uncultured bacterium pG7]